MSNRNPMTKLELDDILEEEIFKDYTTISGLRELSSPHLAETTIRAAIDRRRVVARLYETGGRGIWFIHLPSARRAWPDRFPTENNR